MADYPEHDAGEEFMDVEDAVEGGGYVDDELDVDDDADGDVDPDASDVGLISSSVRVNEQYQSVSATKVADVKFGNLQVPAVDPLDYALVPYGEEDRQLVVARFLTPCPNLAPPSKMRIVKDGERNPKERAEAIKAEKRQRAYENSHVGKARRLTRDRQGYVDIPERDRKQWILDVHNPSASTMDQLSSNNVEQQHPVDHIGSLDGIAGRDDPSTSSSDTRSVFDVVGHDNMQYVGTFEGKSTSRYGMLLVDERTRTAKIIPVGPYAWYSVRQKRGRRPLQKQFESTESAELAMRRKALAGRGKLTKFQERTEEAQAKTEISLGSLRTIREKKEIEVVQAQPSRVAPAERGAEGFDFEQEFDNDDVAQIDMDEVDKDDEAREVRVDREKSAKMFMKLIKDEIVTNPREGSPGSLSGSESDEEDEATSLEALNGILRQADSPNSQTRRPSPKSSPGSQPQSSSQTKSPTLSTGQTTPSSGLPPRAPPSKTSGQSGSVSPPQSIRPGSARLSTPGTGSPGTGSAPGTPLRQEYAHLLPSPGSLPQTKHVVDVLKHMLKKRQNQPVPLKEFTRVFERVTSEQKQNLAAIMKQVAQLIELQPGSKVYYVSLRSLNEGSP